MLVPKQLGPMIWCAMRDVRVMNYGNHIIYEISNNNGFLYVLLEKNTQRLEALSRPTRLSTPVASVTTGQVLQ